MYLYTSCLLWYNRYVLWPCFLFVSSFLYTTVIVGVEAGNAPANTIMLQMSIEDSSHLISDITVRLFVHHIIKNTDTKLISNFIYVKK